MRPYPKRVTRPIGRAINYISIALTLSLIAVTLLQLHALNSAEEQRKDLLVLKQEFAKGSVAKLKEYEKAETQNTIQEDISNDLQFDGKKVVYTLISSHHAASVYEKWTSTITTAKADVRNKMVPKEQRDDSKVVFFIGGHKCGSTTIATYLKHDPKNWTTWDPHGQFMESGKELCWAKKNVPKEDFWTYFRAHGSKTATFALDACPWITEKTHLRRMVESFPNASYLMLVRDPVARVISAINALLDRHKYGMKSIEDVLRNSSLPKRFVRLSMFGNILDNAYSVIPRNKILIVPNQDLKHNVQQTINAIMKHIGALPKNVTYMEANKRKDKRKYQIPTNTTVKWLRDTFYNDWEHFKAITGIHVETIYM